MIEKEKTKAKIAKKKCMKMVQNAKIWEKLSIYIQLFSVFHTFFLITNEMFFSYSLWVFSQPLADFFSKWLKNSLQDELFLEMKKSSGPQKNTGQCGGGSEKQHKRQKLLCPPPHLLWTFSTFGKSVCYNCADNR